MKRMILGVALALVGAAACADESVSGYLRSDGTYVAPHFRSSPNSYRFDNYSSQGNTNPYTGQPGYGRHEFSSPSIYSAPSYGSPYGNGDAYDFGW